MVLINMPNKNKYPNWFFPYIQPTRRRLNPSPPDKQVHRVERKKIYTTSESFIELDKFEGLKAFRVEEMDRDGYGDPYVDITFQFEDKVDRPEEEYKNLLKGYEDRLNRFKRLDAQTELHIKEWPDLKRAWDEEEAAELKERELKQLQILKDKYERK